MTSTPPDSPSVPIYAPPALALSRRGAVLLSLTGELVELSLTDTAQQLIDQPALVCHAPSVGRRLGIAPDKQWFDLLELYAFVRPARFCLPNALGLAEVFGLPKPQPTDLAAQAEILVRAKDLMLSELATVRDKRIYDIAWVMGRNGWPWAPMVLQALTNAGAGQAGRSDGYHVWRQLTEWQEVGGDNPPTAQPVAAQAALDRLDLLRPPQAEPRPGQADYCATLTAAFDPTERQGEPNVVIAEAGTGIGKTIGYIAPASLWAETNGAPVWLSTYTRNLQRQIDGELDRLYPEPVEKARKVVVRKGRENYICLLNYEEAVRGLPFSPRQQIGFGLIARWIQATRDGDLVGGDLPGWLSDLVGMNSLSELTDRRGECIYAACAHYRRCFIERQARRAKRADLVVANHALVMIHALVGGDSGAEIEDARAMPTRYVFDEGHHLFDAADSAFAAHLSAQEMLDLRRWITGDDGGSRSRSTRQKGLAARVGDLDAQTSDALGDCGELLKDLAIAAAVLPTAGWRQRLASDSAYGAAEKFLALVGQQVYARSDDMTGGSAQFSIECDPLPLIDGLDEAAEALETGLLKLRGPLEALMTQLDRALADNAGSIEVDSRRRLMALRGSLMRRALPFVQSWAQMVKELRDPVVRTKKQGFIDWFTVERQGGKDHDVGYYRHWIDPTRPFMAALSETAQGFAITSATLRDGEDAGDWAASDRRTGAIHLSRPPVKRALQSPFDYAAQTRLLIVNDVDRNSMDQIAGAYRGLFEAAQGGALGLFTAVSRLRAVHQRIEKPLDATGLDLLAQHVDPVDVATLVDLFRADENSCLLGTDAVRDGVDVPGRSLRLIVFDRVPWPRPSICHRARREAFGDRGWDDQLVRLKLRQAFGRLVRRADDNGVFVLLDSRMPTRLLNAFPEGVTAERVGIKQAIELTGGFL